MGNFYKHVFYQNYLSLPSTIIKTISRNCRGKKFEPEIEALKLLVKPGFVCLDVGGAYGRYALPLSRMIGPLGRVYSFEPGSYSSKVFKIVKFIFALKNVFLIKKAVSDQKGSIELCLPSKKSGKLGASLAFIDSGNKEDDFSETVEMIKLDDFVDAEELTRLDLIKCDTEGSEQLVFKGARAIIERFKPIVLTEIDQNNLFRFGQKPSDIINFFRILNYKLMIWEAGDFIAVNSADEPRNYFFIPEHIEVIS